MTPEKLIDEVMRQVSEEQPENYDAWFSIIVGETLKKVANIVEKYDQMHTDADGTVHYSGIGKLIADDIRALIKGP